MMRITVFVVQAMALLLPGVVLAHASVDHAAPKVGSTVTKSPACVKVWFDDDVDPAKSTLVVCDCDGKQVDRKDACCGEDDKSLLMVTLPDLADGTYVVSWRVVAADTHKTHGEFKFTVKRSD